MLELALVTVNGTSIGVPGTSVVGIHVQRDGHRGPGAGGEERAQAPGRRDGARRP